MLHPLSSEHSNLGVNGLLLRVIVRTTLLELLAVLVLSHFEAFVDPLRLPRHHYLLRPDLT